MDTCPKDPASLGFSVLGPRSFVPAFLHPFSSPLTLFSHFTSSILLVTTFLLAVQDGGLGCAKLSPFTSWCPIRPAMGASEIHHRTPVHSWESEAARRHQVYSWSVWIQCQVSLACVDPFQTLPSELMSANVSLLDLVSPSTSIKSRSGSSRRACRPQRKRRYAKLCRKEQR